jgi:DNA-directed RNA polymerase subunit RPC12/RpoP
LSFHRCSINGKFTPQSLVGELKFYCSKCGQPIECDERQAGSPIVCPGCQQSIVIPNGRMIQIRLPKMRSVIIAGAGVVLAAGVIFAIVFFTGSSTRAAWKQWTVLAGNKRQWTFASGTITGHSTTAGSLFASKKKYGDVTFSATVSTANREATLAIRMQDARNGYLVVFVPAGTPPPWNPNGYIAIVRQAGGDTTLAKFDDAGRMAALGQKVKLTVIAHGDNIEVQVNGTKILSAQDSTFPSGRVGLRIYGDGQFPCDGMFSDISFR